MVAYPRRRVDTRSVRGEYVAMPTPARPPGVLGADRTPAVRNALLLILGLNAVGAAVKLAVGIRTGALAVSGAALESGLDMLNNVIGMSLVRVAGQAPDENHPYGHEKFETLGALGIVGFLSVSCFELVREGVQKLLHGAAPRGASTAELASLIATLLLNVFVVTFERRRGRELGSQFLLADASHTRSDTFVTALALASLVLTRAGLGTVDGALAIAVALVIAWTGYQILRESVPILVDERAIEASELRRLLAEIPQIADVRVVRSRRAPSGMLFAEVTIGVDASLSVADAHRLADAVEAKIGDRLGAAEVTVHVEPA
jgi:cation diffusion facilitator family transporter